MNHHKHTSLLTPAGESVTWRQKLLLPGNVSVSQQKQEEQEEWKKKESTCWGTDDKNMSRTLLFCLTVSCLSEVLSGEHALGPAQDRVLGRVVRMLFGRDLQDGRDRLHVSVNGVTDHLSNELVDQDDADVVTRQEAPAQKGGGALTPTSISSQCQSSGL